MNQNTKKKALILIGSPASGKDTLAKYVSEKYNCPIISMSDLIKDFSKNSQNTEILEILKKGELLRDKDIFEIFKERFEINSLYKNEKLIILGIPRTLNQLFWLDGYLNLNRYKRDYLLLENRYEILKERILKRKKIENRTDDNIEIFNKRYKIYKEYEKKILKFREMFRIINGDLDIEGVRKETEKTLKEIQF